MRNLILIIAGVVDLSANVPYIIDSLRGTTKPNTASWSTWTVINGITIVAALQAGDAINTVVLGFTYFAASLSVLLIALFKGMREYTLFDGICQLLAIIGIVIWQVSGNPNIALLFVIISGEMAALPTFRHAYIFPNEETLSSYVIASMVAIVFVLSATTISFASLAVPIDLVIGNGIIATIIYLRRSKLSLSIHNKT
jgi:hypothetical protein